MRSRKLYEKDGLRIYVAVLDSGDAVADCLLQIAREERLNAAQVTAIGAFESATLAFFDWQSKEYEKIPVPEQAEVLSLLGDIAIDPEGEPKLHLHAVLGRRGGSVVGGHLLDARVRPTLEVMINESPAHLQRVHDSVSGVALIQP